MLLKEWNMDDALRVRERDGIQQGRQEGRREIQEQTARNMKAEGFDLHAIARITGLTFDEVLRL
jgi:predicted transposase/invertase (TIGR01784 family)